MEYTAELATRKASLALELMNRMFQHEVARDAWS
jgi:hypothetical protein